jgi:DNA repair photolyase
MNSIKGRGANSNRASRHLENTIEREPSPDGETSLHTECLPETVKTIISRNQSPDIPFEQSINPYRGCEHGCVYCYARPTHAWLDLSPGLDFESRISYKHNAAQALERELRRPGYKCTPITIGANTDPYQPAEKEYRITRQVLEVLHRYHHPLSIITRGPLIERDIDLLADMAGDGLVSVAFSVTTLDSELKRRMEPRAASATARLKSIEALAGAGVPVSVFFAPVIPALNDSDLESVLELAALAGARQASYILLRLPLEIAELFQEWLQEHYPLRAEHVLSLVRQCRGGRDYDTRFGHRMRGTGPFAELLEQRFDLACRKYGLRRRRETAATCDLFALPAQAGDQIDLFDKQENT